MDYYKKYLKYKKKYINKLELFGGEIVLKCPYDKPHLCPLDTNNYGLCVNKDNIAICNADTYDYIKDVEIETPDLSKLIGNEKEELDIENNKGKTKGYVDNFLKKSCYIQSTLPNPFITEYDIQFNIPKNFSIITLNVMGIIRNISIEQITLMTLRINMLKKYILSCSPDILCFQELSLAFFSILYDDIRIKTLYPYYYEDNFLSNQIKDREKDIEIFVLTKYPLKKISVHALEGNLTYTNSIGIYEFNNLIIFNVYLQAGSKNSPGQKNKWIHYSRCRSNQFRFISKLMKQYTKPIIVLGDFNFDINAVSSFDNENWPEIREFKEMKLNDSWYVLNSNKPQDEGLTENTDINHMRYNSKFEEKKYRYDAILYSQNEKLKPKLSQVICNKGLTLDDKIQSSQLIIDWIGIDYKTLNNYYKTIILPKNITKVPIKNQIDDIDIFDLFISDHFGIYTEFELIE
jgi:exonuclease III